MNNDGLHGMAEASGKVSLQAGRHRIVAEYFQRGGGKGLEVSFEGPQIQKQFIPPSLLFYD